MRGPHRMQYCSIVKSVDTAAFSEAFHRRGADGALWEQTG
jgi:hypothetical protein